MPSLRISFPEKESPSVVVLRGKRITIGRLPQNTIQIRDRTISGRHAELIEEEDHYRLHDLDATNGILVNGEAVTDFHLREGCKVTFGGVECEFSPETPAETEIDPSVALLSRGESETLLTKNTELEKTISSLRAEIAELQKPVGDSQEVNDLQRLTAELNTVKESLAARDRDFQQLKTDLALTHRDRMNLQRALKEAKATSEPVPAAASAPAAEEAPKQPEPTSRPAAVPIPAPAPQPMAEFPAAKPVVPPSKPALPKPKAPLPHANPTPAAPMARPVAKPQAGAPNNGNGTPVTAAKPSPYAKSPAGGANPQATPKPSLATRPPTAVSGPKGTQKIG
jgi:pSer/pThr/pTyr-binding forkhead associated (FHA) protein